VTPLVPKASGPISRSIPEGRELSMARPFRFQEILWVGLRSRGLEAYWRRQPSGKPVRERDQLRET